MTSGNGASERVNWVHASLAFLAVIILAAAGFVVWKVADVNARARTPDNTLSVGTAAKATPSTPAANYPAPTLETVPEIDQDAENLRDQVRIFSSPADCTAVRTQVGNLAAFAEQNPTEGAYLTKMLAGYAEVCGDKAAHSLAALIEASNSQPLISMVSRQAWYQPREEPTTEALSSFSTTDGQLACSYSSGTLTCTLADSSQTGIGECGGGPLTIYASNADHASYSCGSKVAPSSPVAFGQSVETPEFSCTLSSPNNYSCRVGSFGFDLSPGRLRSR